ncbi:TetR/AcrR family transcriptional regulator [Actinocrispum sp. NPDC049592]|uniref:TetR/AcrR family transcriptional regulator n=1 Tax=Actinocrispum sp. NPDC049592 TaxID=3154835 RepID=UPI0034235A87
MTTSADHQNADGKTPNHPDSRAASSGRAPLRRQDGRILAPGSKGAATRQRLLDAARRLLEQQGYRATTVAQISESAGVSLGTFYQYFRDRADVMAALAQSYVTEVLDGGRVHWSIDNGRSALNAMLIDYVTTYAENAAFNQVWEEVCQTEPELADLRRELTTTVEASVVTALRRGARKNLFPPVRNPAATARALCALADRFCYLTYAFDPAEPPMDPVMAAELIADIWARTVGLPD